MPKVACTGCGLLCLLAAILYVTCWSYAISAERPVDVALVLAVDASQSMDDEEQGIQRTGYVQALTSPEVLMAIGYGRHKRIAVAYFEWGSFDQQVLVAPWAIIDSAESAAAFAQRITEAPRNNFQRTSISAALSYSDALLAGSGYAAARRVVDVSGDGPNNQGQVVTDLRDKLVSQGITINGLPIIVKDVTPMDWSPIPRLDVYYEECVIGGDGSFSIPVVGMGNFAAALKMKLVMEIAGLTVDRPKVIPAAAPAPINCSYYE